MSNIKLLFSFILLSVTSSHLAAADFPLQFGELDADNNAYISSKEASVRKDLVKNFKKIDRDADGKIDLSEYQAYEGKGRYQPPEETETPELGAAPTE